MHTIPRPLGRGGGHSISKSVWIRKGITPIRMTTGSKRKLYLFGAVTLKKEQTFLILDDKRMRNPDKKAKKKWICKFNWKTTSKFIYLLKSKYGKFVLVWDKAGHHNHKKVKRYIKENKDWLKVISFPTAASEANPVEECWRQSKGTICGKRMPDTYDAFNGKATHYFRHKRFNLDIRNYLCP